MPSSPLPLAGVGLEMLSSAFEFALFHAANADSQEYFSFVVLKVMSARGSKILILQLVVCFVW